MTRLEALLDAIGHLNGAFDDPDAPAYQLRNPLLIKSWGIPGKHDTDMEGRRKFSSLVSGYRAGLYDLQIKASGQSRAKVSASDPLSVLLKIYGIAEPTGQRKIVNFLRHALHDESIASTTSLTYFVSDVV